MSIIYWFTVIISIALSIEAFSPPGPPTNVIVVSDVDNIGVQWQPPFTTFGNIQKYIVSYAILPSFVEKTNVVGSDVTMSIIPVQEYRGRLFRIRIQAENEGGLSDFSKPKYVRIECGKEFDIFPGENVTVTSPGFKARDPLQPGMLCLWTFRTIPKYSIVIVFDVINLNVLSNISCSDNYIDISGIGRRCHKNISYKTVRTRFGTVELKFRTGFKPEGSGFVITVKTAVLLPTPPSQITLRTSDHAIIVSWQPPISDTVNISAYHIRYSVPTQKHTMEITVGRNMRHFAVNTDTFEGRLVIINMTAVIGFEDGMSSHPYFVRAPCRRRIHLDDFETTNISSPGYPLQYPSNIICAWIVTSEPEEKMSITYLDFRIESTSFCSSDFIKFSFQQNPVCSRADLPKTLLSVSNNFTLTFVTDGNNEFKGFLIQVTAMSHTTRFIPSSIVTSATHTDHNVPKLTAFPHTLWPLPTHVWTISPSKVTSNRTNILNIFTTTAPRSKLTLFGTNDSSYNITSVSSAQHPFQGIISRPVTSPTNAAIDTTQTGRIWQTKESGLAVTETPWRSHQKTQSSGHVEYMQQKHNRTDGYYEPAKSGNNVVTVCISLFGCILIISVMILYVKRRHTRTKINPFPRHDETNIELHDIIPHKTGSSKLSCKTTSGDKLKNISRFTNERKLDVIPEVAELDPEESSYKKTGTRERCNSFPFSFSMRKRQLFKEIQKSLNSLSFIEDKKSLEQSLKRKHGLIRTSSF